MTCNAGEMKMDQDEWVKYVGELLKARPSVAIVIDAGESLAKTHTSHLTPHTSHLTPHTSHLTPHTSHLTLFPAANTDYEAWLKLKAAVPSHVTLVGQVGVRMSPLPRCVLCDAPFCSGCSTATWTF